MLLGGAAECGVNVLLTEDRWLLVKIIDGFSLGKHANDAAEQLNGTEDGSQEKQGQQQDHGGRQEGWNAVGLMDGPSVGEDDGGDVRNNGDEFLHENILNVRGEGGEESRNE